MPFTLFKSNSYPPNMHIMKQNDPYRNVMVAEQKKKIGKININFNRNDELMRLQSWIASFYDDTNLWFWCWFYSSGLP